MKCSMNKQQMGFIFVGTCLFIILLLNPRQLAVISTYGRLVSNLTSAMCDLRDCLYANCYHSYSRQNRLLFVLITINLNFTIESELKPELCHSVIFLFYDRFSRTMISLLSSGIMQEKFNNEKKNILAYLSFT